MAAMRRLLLVPRLEHGAVRAGLHGVPYREAVGVGEREGFFRSRFERGRVIHIGRRPKVLGDGPRFFVVQESHLFQCRRCAFAPLQDVGELERVGCRGEDKELSHGTVSTCALLRCDCGAVSTRITCDTAKLAFAVVRQSVSFADL